MTCAIVIAMWKDRRLDQTFMQVVERVPNSALVIILEQDDGYMANNFIQKNPLIAKPVCILRRKNESFFIIHWYCNKKHYSSKRFGQSMILSGYLRNKSPKRLEILLPRSKMCHHYLSERQVNISTHYIYPYSYK